MAQSEEFQNIDIRSVIKGKSPGIAKILPGFAYRYIHRIMHIDFINDFLKRNGHFEGIDFINATISEFKVKEEVIGFENIEKGRKYIFASNHPLGGFDGMLLIKTINSKFKSVKFLTNDILMNIKQIRPLFVPVNKHGGQARESAKQIDQLYSNESQVAIFPSGLASRKIKGKIIDLDWHKHFISKAIQYKRDIVPVFITGRNSNRFYRIAKFRKFFRIKWNLEMFFLADETLKHRNQNITLYFGKPIPYTLFDKSKTHKEWATYVKNIVYKLQGKNK